MRSDGVLTGTFTMPVAVYPNDAAKLAFMDRVMPALAALPGVIRSSSTVQALPLDAQQLEPNVWLEGDPIGADAPRRQPFCSVVAARLLRDDGHPLKRRPRLHCRATTRARCKVAIVSETAARTLWQGKEPLGQRFKWGARRHDWLRHRGRRRRAT